MRALAFKPSSFTRCSSPISVIEAPSVNGDELPAVNVPYFLSNAGLSLLRASTVESALIMLSSAMQLSNLGAAHIGTISSASTPSSLALCASYENPQRIDLDRLSKCYFFVP